MGNYSACQVCKLPANLTIKDIPGTWCRDHLPVSKALKKFIHHTLQQLDKTIKDDDPKGNCAAYHRGEKAALKLIQDFLERNEF